MHKPLRLLKFDSCHPLSYLAARQQAEAEQIRHYNYQQYYDWLMNLRVGLSDYLTYPMNQAGWEAREYIPWDDILLAKAIEAQLVKRADKRTLWRPLVRHVGRLTLRDVALGRWASAWRQERRNWLIERYIETYQPDVIFVREPCHLNGKFWDRFRDKCVIASFIACNTNHAINWDPHRNDVIFTLTQQYRDFFRVQGIETHLLQYGIDERVFAQLEAEPKQYDCTFVGYLGQSTQSRKTELLEQVAAAVDFKWWGVKGEQIGRFPALERTWQGPTGGIEMLRIYRRSRIVLNDYVDMAAGANVNIRTTEVLGVASMLLTREAANIAYLENAGALATFTDAADCVAKVKKYLADETRREAIAQKGHELASKELNYRDIAQRVMDIIREEYEKKRSLPCRKSWAGAPMR